MMLVEYINPNFFELRGINHQQNYSACQNTNKIAILSEHNWCLIMHANKIKVLTVLLLSHLISLHVYVLVTKFLVFKDKNLCDIYMTISWPNYEISRILFLEVIRK